MNKILENLNPAQQAAVRHGKGPMLVLAGAGSGKTRVLIQRIAYLVDKHGVDPGQILAVTFTNKAAAELKERIIKLLDSKTSSQPTASTFHSFCALLLRREGRHVGVSQDFVIYDDGDQQGLIRNILKELDLSPKKFRPGSILANISSSKNELITPDKYSQMAHGAWQEMVANVYPKYQKMLMEAGALDFDDLLLKAVELFRENPEVLDKYQEKFPYILVDEYQDTNTAQYVLTKLLAQKYQNICVVGDCSQSIYSWRGADYRNILNFDKAFSEVTVYELEQNYRSTQNILDAAYAVIGQNTTHPVLKLWTDSVDGEHIKLYEAISEKDEAEYVIRTMLKLHQLDPDLKAMDMVVLYRTNAQSRALEEMFLHYGIPYGLVGGVRFYERKEIKDVLAMLRLAVNTNDIMARFRVEKIGKRMAIKLLEFLESSGELKEELTTLEIMDELFQITRYLERYTEHDEEDQARLDNIRELKSVAAEYPNLVNFLENVALVEREISSTTKNEALVRGGRKDVVTLMTLHQAKGLEYRVVFIVGMEEGIFPHSRSIDDLHELEEERRLAYVGITRAKERLYMTYARRRMYFGRYNSNPVSRFIAEIPEELIDYEVIL